MSNVLRKFAKKAVGREEGAIGGMRSQSDREVRAFSVCILLKKQNKNGMIYITRGRKSGSRTTNSEVLWVCNLTVTKAFVTIEGGVVARIFLFETIF